MALSVMLACDGPTRTVRVPVGPSAEAFATLDRAVATLNTSRTALLATADALPDAARALDAADEAAATGQREFAADARATARPAVAQVGPTLARLSQQADAYRVALNGLGAAADAFGPTQRDSLRAAATAGYEEAGALSAFGDAVRAAWPAYAALDQAQATWLDRARAGWYRSTKEAADAYVVLRNPGLGALERARRSLQEADQARRPATERMRAALDAADASLDALRAPAG